MAADRALDYLAALEPETAQLIVQLQMEDLDDIPNTSNGSDHAEPTTDGELAWKIYMDEMKSTAQVLSDRQMSQSIARAVHADERALKNIQEVEKVESRDRRLALEQLDNSDHPMPAPHDEPVPPQDDITKSSEILAIMAARYNSEQDGLEYLQEESGEGPSDSQKDPMASSSSSTANKDGCAAVSVNRKCAVCGEEFKFFDVARLPCGHDYCRECLEELFTQAAKDQTLFPPRCCREPVHISLAKLFVKAATLEALENKKVEYETSNRTYCCIPTCGAFIEPERIANDTGTCSVCQTRTCAHCKAQAHGGDCAEDHAKQQVLDVAKAEGWQRCNRCSTMIELKQGCYHITCPCGNHFCYLCGQTWKQCACAHWDEHRLLDRVVEVAERDLGGARADPARVAQLMQDIRGNHECDHTNWRYRSGAHQCEECRQRLPNYIFQCAQCHILACNRCRRNRL